MMMSLYIMIKPLHIIVITEDNDITTIHNEFFTSYYDYTTSYNIKATFRQLWHSIAYSLYIWYSDRAICKRSTKINCMLSNRHLHWFFPQQRIILFMKNLNSTTFWHRNELTHFAWVKVNFIVYAYLRETGFKNEI